MSLKRLAAAGLVASATLVGSLAVYENYTSTAVIPIPGDVPTVGFGSTKGVKLGDKTDPVRAVVRLATEATEFSKKIGACIGDVPLYQYEFDAYVSMAYNIGPSAFCGSSVVRYLHQTPPDYAAACRAILPWNKANGRVVQGLVNRRAAEYKQCTGEVS
jgi:lysozyme